MESLALRTRLSIIQLLQPRQSFDANPLASGSGNIRGDIMQAQTNLSATQVTTKTEALKGALMATVLGVVLVWGVGFSHIEAVHNAAHDTRHANAFPCH